MTWTPRDVAALVITLALALAFLAVVVGGIVRGPLADSTREAVAAAFVLMLAMVASYFGLSRRPNGAPRNGGGH